jgi:hypothetical protein
MREQRVEAPKEISKKKAVTENRCDPAIEQAILKILFEQPAQGHVHVSSRTENTRPTRTARYVNIANFRQIKY